MTKYIYTKKINSSQLANEITTSTSINTAFDHIDILSDGLTVNIWFKSDLQSAEITALGVIVSAHVPTTINPVSIVGDSTKNIDPYTKKLIMQDQPYNGPLYVPNCNFKTGKDSSDLSWKPPASNLTNNFWSIDISTSGITKITFAPNYNYQVDGLGYRTFGTIANDAFIQKIVLNPHIPAQYGGSYSFTEGRRLIANDSFYRYTAPKFVPKQATIPGVGVVATNILQFIISHDPEENISMEVMASIYPQ